MDLETLLQPINADSPSGEDMSFSVEFDAIAEARRFDDPSLHQGEWITDLKQADWADVIRLCSELLAHRTKDLRLAVWLTEAMAKTNGIAGLAHGLELIKNLCSTFWTDLHPVPDDDGDQEQRVGNLEWLITRAESLAREMPLTLSSKGAYSTADLESAMNVAKAIERNPSDAENLQANARVSQADFDAARDDTPGNQFVEWRDQTRDALQALSSLQQLVDELLGADAPGFGAARNALESLEHTLGRFAVAAGVGDTAEADTSSLSDTPTDEQHSNTATEAPPMSGPLQNRTQALQQLRQVADFFRRTEPHSPVAYLADKAAQWGEMSLHEWLKTVVKDDGALAHVEELLGIPASYPSDDQYG